MHRLKGAQTLPTRCCLVLGYTRNENSADGDGAVADYRGTAGHSRRYKVRGKDILCTVETGYDSD